MSWLTLLKESKNEGKRYNADVTLTLHIQYDDIEADSKEEAKTIACQRACEDVDWNNCDCSDEEVDAFVWR